MVAVADLFRSAEMLDEAIALYKSAVAKAPGSPQYAEYLGEFYHRLKRPADAMSDLVEDGRAPQPKRQDPRPARRGSLRLSVTRWRPCSPPRPRPPRSTATISTSSFDSPTCSTPPTSSKTRRKQLELAAKAATGDEQTEGRPRPPDQEPPGLPASSGAKIEDHAVREGTRSRGKTRPSERWRKS